MTEKFVEENEALNVKQEEKEVEKTDIQIFEEKMNENIQKLLEHVMIGYDEKTKQPTEVILGDVISREHIWYSENKPKPIINEEGVEKIARSVGAVFPKLLYIEKQSDYRNVAGGQVIVEATVLFPDNTSNVDIGVANGLNCKGDISKSQMPIMAVKRAKSRALLRSDKVNLKAFDESEVSDEISKMYERSLEDNKAIRVELENATKKANSFERAYLKKVRDFDKLYDLIKENIKYVGKDNVEKLIWELEDPEKINQFLEKKSKTLNTLEIFLYKAKSQDLMKKIKEENKIKKQQELKLMKDQKEAEKNQQ
jgi:hypothetical protein